MADLKIAIIGAGPAGCMLARLLHLSGISSTIFEGEKTLDFRSQGGTLDLHTESGLKALKQANLYDDFLKYARFDGEAMTVASKDLVKYIRLNGAKESRSSYGRPEIDRPKLRQILVESIPKDCIRWGKRLRSIDSDLTLNFEDGSESGFDLVVGADGAFSKVRPLLSDAKPEYSGIGGYQCSVLNAKEAESELYDLVNRGTTFSFSDHKSIIGQQMGDGSLSNSTWAVTKEQNMKRLNPDEAKIAKETFRKDHHDWHPTLLDLVEKADDASFVYRPLYMLPIGHKWNHRPGVTLLGDSAHLMTPFAGEGVNLAFSDAMALASALVKTNDLVKNCKSDEVVDIGTALSKNVKAFEKDMFKRATEVQQQTYNNMQAMYFLEGPPDVVARTFMLTAVSDQLPWILYPIVASLFYIYFFIHGMFRLGQPAKTP